MVEVMSTDIEAVRAHINDYFQTMYRCTLDDVVITSTPSYWEKQVPCGGQGFCRHPLHGFLFNEGPIRHTVSYFDRRRDKQGRFVSPTHSWRLLWGIERGQ